MRTEPWWTCSCGAKVYPVKKSKGLDWKIKTWQQHVASCPITEQKKKAPPGTYIPQGLHIVQHPQGKR